MYTNIPIAETKNILKQALINNLTQQNEIDEILNWYDIITRQNYCCFNKTMYTQLDGLAMGAPSSGFISEIFLQYIECNTILPILNKHHISGYYRYVDDILILY
jgi:coproporphyrinogen III oxidase-like Fe-S oxidoreductase